MHCVRIILLVLIIAFADVSLCSQKKAAIWKRAIEESKRSLENSKGEFLKRLLLVNEKENNGDLKEQERETRKVTSPKAAEDDVLFGHYSEGNYQRLSNLAKENCNGYNLKVALQSASKVTPASFRSAAQDVVKSVQDMVGTPDNNTAVLNSILTFFKDLVNGNATSRKATMDYVDTYVVPKIIADHKKVSSEKFCTIVKFLPTAYKVFTDDGLSGFTHDECDNLYSFIYSGVKSMQPMVDTAFIAGANASFVEDLLCFHRRFVDLEQLLTVAANLGQGKYVDPNLGLDQPTDRQARLLIAAVELLSIHINYEIAGFTAAAESLFKSFNRAFKSSAQPISTEATTASTAHVQPTTAAIKAKKELDFELAEDEIESLSKKEEKKKKELDSEFDEDDIESLSKKTMSKKEEEKKKELDLEFDEDDIESLSKKTMSKKEEKKELDLDVERSLLEEEKSLSEKSESAHLVARYEKAIEKLKRLIADVDGKP